MAGVSELERLRLNRWGGADYVALAGLEKLSDLWIASTDAQSLKGLGQCGSLDRLHMELPTGTADLGELAPLSRLVDLRLFGAREITNLEFVAAMPALKKLTLGDVGSLETLATLPRHERLKSVELSGVASLASLDGLDGLTGLEGLRVSDLPAPPDLAPLTRLTGLNVVRLALAVGEDPMYFFNSECAYRATAPFDALVDCPALECVELDSEHRAAEIKATLALRRKDQQFVRREGRNWGELMMNAPEPAQTIPKLLVPIVEVLGQDGALCQLTNVLGQMRKWEESIRLMEEGPVVPLRVLPLRRGHSGLCGEPDEQG